MKIEELKKVIEILREEYPKLKAPIEKLIAHKKGDPFRALVCTLLSTRTKDETTAEVCQRLFERVKNWEDLLAIDLRELESFYTQWVFTKTRQGISKSWQGR